MIRITENRLYGQLFGLILGDGRINKESISFCNTNERYLKYFFKIMNCLFFVEPKNMKFYLQGINHRMIEKKMKNLIKRFPELKEVNYREYKNKTYKKVCVDVRYYNSKLSKKILQKFEDCVINIPNERGFLEGFIDGIIASEGHAEVGRHKRIVICQNKGEVADMICNVLTKLNVSFFCVVNKKKKLLIRIAKKKEILKILKFCDISKDKLERFENIENWIPRSPHLTNVIGVLKYLKENRTATRQDIINELKIKNPNHLFYCRNSPLHKHKLVKKIGKPRKLILTQKGRKFLEDFKNRSVSSLQKPNTF